MTTLRQRAGRFGASWGARARRLTTGRVGLWARGLAPRLRGWRSERMGRPPSEVAPPTPLLVRRFASCSRVLAALAIIGGYHVFVGWVFDISLLKSPGAGYLPMSAPAGLAALFAGIALYLLNNPRAAEGSGPRRVAVTAAAAAVTGLMGICDLVETAVDGPRLALFLPHTGSPVLQMRAFTSVSFVFLSASLLVFLLRAGEPWRKAGEALCLPPAAICLLGLAGYAYGAKPFPGEMSLYGSILILVLSVGALLSKSDEGAMAKVASDSFGGLMARRLLPASLIIPLVLGWLERRGLSVGLFSPESGLAALAVADIAAFVGVVWWSVNSLYRMDTARRRVERDLNETAAKLRRSNADLEQFAYVASHDLKEPLRAIGGSVQVLQKRLGEHVTSEAVEIVSHTVEGVARMQTLIDDLLTYSRVSTEERPPQPIESSTVLLEALASLEASIQEAHAVVTADPLPVIRADATQLRQVFQNLLSNGVKYRSQRTPKLHVTAEERETEWVFSVRDNGIGIAPQYQDRIFKIFQRLHSRREYPGTGIGLAICKKIVERHGGRIWVESEPEEGSTFFFSLPK